MKIHGSRNQVADARTDANCHTAYTATTPVGPGVASCPEEGLRVLAVAERPYPNLEVLEPCHVTGLEFVVSSLSAILVGGNLGEIAFTNAGEPATSLLSAAALVGVVQTPGLSHLANVEVVQGVFVDGPSEQGWPGWRRPWPRGAVRRRAAEDRPKKEGAW